MKILTAIGARPQFIKAAAVSRELRKQHREILVHTGQHYDENMSDVFFNELGIPKPDYNLGVGSSSHARQTAQMLVGLEDIMLKEKPEAVLIYGDTNSTLAAALAAAKLCIPIAHVEAGVRTFCSDMPEEQNRKIADHLATWNFAPSQVAAVHLANEGIVKGVTVVGDVMCDALMYFSGRAAEREKSYYLNNLQYIVKNSAVLVDKWYIATVHRPENTDAPAKLPSILEGLNSLPHPVIFPVHPRIKAGILGLCSKSSYKNIHFVEPLSYFETIFFLKNAVKAITDSGGLHKEAFMLGVPALVLLRSSPWEETLAGNCNILCTANSDDILNKALHTQIDYACFENKPYGDGTAAVKLTQVLLK